MSANLVLNGPNLNLLGRRGPEIAPFDGSSALDEPLIEVHLSNIYRRQGLRQHSHVPLTANGLLCGFDPGGALMAPRPIAAMSADATSD